MIGAMSVGKKALFAAAVMVLFLTLVEGASRWWSPVSLPDPLIGQRRADWAQTRVYDPRLFWRLRPGAQVGTLRINSHGLRGPEIPPRRAGELRLLSLGESTTFGARVAFEETYSARLEADLAETGGPVRVINAGVPGYTLFQGVTYLRTAGLALEPDVVLTYFGYNDFLPVVKRAPRDARSRPATAGLTDRQLSTLRGRPAARLHEGLMRISNAYRWAAGRLRPATAAAAPVEERPRVPAADRWWLLEELEVLCQERGVRWVMIVPWYGRFTEHEELLRRFAAERDVPVVDLPRLLKEPDGEHRRYFSDAIHPTAEGHRRMAEVIAGEVRRWLPSHGTPEGDA